ncbi:phage tail tape measure protein [Pokkaliibacter plantistimulans]|uniref:Phage tail tape measure protein n=1 Tax=Proteobacteria bacterium 228 TaxID=2083153 RepID=A0A2S5KT67_9PROT|nr:phage tail tape measure protein [Pokkaliibacter plantistimulans]PPC77940.1 phage tail tape measure protein [Pokkaliibacter plantistimulans]
MNTNTIELKIKAGVDGTLDVRDLTRQLDELGGDTSAVSKETADLASKLTELDNAQRLIDGLRTLRSGVEETAQTMAAAELRTQQLGQQLATTEKPSAGLRREFERQRTALLTLRESHQQQIIRLQQTRAELNAAGISTGTLSSHQKQLATEAQQVSTRLDELKQSLAQQISQQQKATEQTERFNRQLNTVADAQQRIKVTSPESAFRTLADRASAAERDVNALAAELNGLGVDTQKVSAETTGLAARLAELGRSQRLIEELRTLRNGVEETAQTMATAELRTQQLGQQLATTEKPSAGLRREFERQRTALLTLRDSYQQQVAHLQQTRAELSAAGISTRELGTHQKQLAAEADKVTKRLDELKQSLQQQVAEEQHATDSAGQYHRRLGLAEQAQHNIKASSPATTFRAIAEEANSADLTIGGLAASLLRLHPAVAAVAAATAGLAAAGAGGIRSAAELEQQLDRVAAVSGATGDQLIALKVAADQAGKSTQYTATQAAQGLEILARAGFNATQAIQVLPSLLNTATVENTGLAEAAQLVTDTLTIMQKQVGEAASVADILAKGSALANTNMSELGTAITYAGAGAVNAGISLQELVAILDALATNGLRGERAGSGLRYILAQLAIPSSQASNELRKLGITSTNLIEVVDQLRTKGEASKEVIAAFGVEAGPILQALLKQGAEGIARFEQQLNSATGSTQQMADQINRGLNGALLSLQSAWDGLTRSFGDQWLQSLNQQLESLTSKVRELNDSGSLEVWGQMTVGVFERVTGGVRATYNGITFTLNAIGTFATGTLTALSYVAEKGAAVLNMLGVVSDETLQKFETNTGAMSAVTQNFYNSAIEDAQDFGAGAKQVLFGLEQQSTATTQAVTQAATDATQATAQAAQTAADSAGQAMNAVGTAAQQTSAQVGQGVDAVGQKTTALKAALEALGVDFHQVMGGLSADFQLVLNNLDIVSRSADATGKAITAAFTAAIEKANTAQELDALQTQLIQLQGTTHTTGIAFESLFDQITDKADPARQALLQLGVPMDKLRNEISDTERQMVSALQTITKAGNASSKELNIAFRNAIAKAETLQGLEAIQAELRKTGNTAQMSSKDFSDAMHDARSKADQLKAELKQLKDGGGDAMQSLASDTHKVTDAANKAADAYDRMGEAADKASRQGNRKVNATNQTAKAIQSKGDEQAQQQLAELNALYTRQVNNARIPGEITNATNSYNEQAKRILAQSEARGRRDDRDQQRQERSTQPERRADPAPSIQTSRFVTVTFATPDGRTTQGHFPESDADRFLSQLADVASISR